MCMISDWAMDAFALELLSSLRLRNIFIVFSYLIYIDRDECVETLLLRVLAKP